MQKSTQVILSGDLGEFFRQEVCDARTNLGISMSDHTEHYVVTMLCDFSRRENQPGMGDEPLALLYKRALEASLAEKAHLLKQLGDVSLYIAGFFTESIERSLVDIDYYIAMGGNAYGNLAQVVGGMRHGDTFAEIYCQLAKQFSEMVELLNEISGRGLSTAPDADLLRLYDRWVRTKSERVRRLLVDRGLVPADDLPDEYVQ